MQPVDTFKRYAKPLGRPATPRCAVRGMSENLISMQPDLAYVITFEMAFQPLEQIRFDLIIAPPSARSLRPARIGTGHGRRSASPCGASRHRRGPGGGHRAGREPARVIESGRSQPAQCAIQARMLRRLWRAVGMLARGALNTGRLSPTRPIVPDRDEVLASPHPPP
jgi:hypothetical protein